MPSRIAHVALLGAIGLAVGSGCRESTKPGRSAPAVEGVRIVNGYTGPVDLLVDGVLAASGVAPGGLDSVQQGAGLHTVALRASGETASVSVPVTTEAGAFRTVAAVRLGGVLSASALDDTNAVVPAGATKVRVLHLAPNAGEIQVFRTQPDWGTPIEWKFPFLYDSATIDPLANPYYQSTVGTWDVRAWRKPSEVALGWDGTTARVTFDLASGQKRTVLVLDRPGGGIRLRVIE
jgi:hypothetical protein